MRFLCALVCLAFLQNVGMEINIPDRAPMAKVKASIKAREPSNVHVINVTVITAEFWTAKSTRASTRIKARNRKNCVTHLLSSFTLSRNADKDYTILS